MSKNEDPGDDDSAIVNDFIPPPPFAPPILSKDQILQLAKQGWLRFPLPYSLITALQKLSEQTDIFFTLPLDDKKRLYPSTQGTESGYYLVPDEKEYLTLRHHFHLQSQDHVSTLESCIAEVWAESAALLKRMLVDLARGLAWPVDALDGMLEGCMHLPSSPADATPSLLRCFRYEATKGVADQHSDLGLLTLCIGRGKGLQVLDREVSTHEQPVWLDVGSDETTTEATVVVGDFLRDLSKSLVRSGLHRVVGNPQGRESVIFALRPDVRHGVVDGRVFGREDESLDLAEMWRGNKGLKTNVNARKEIRERQTRERLEKWKEREREKALPGFG